MKKYTDRGKKDTRSGFGAGLLEAGKADSRVVALTADLKGSLKMDAFAAEFPQRYYECGIAEANMIGVASGMALTGKVPFAGSFAEFVTGRAISPICALSAAANGSRTPTASRSAHMPMSSA